MIKFLVVDDEKGMVDDLKDFLEARDYRVFTAVSGEEALTIAKKETPNIVILDIRMPGIGGMEVLREIKKSYPKTRVVMLTGVEDENTRKMAMALGASGYLTKPFSFGEIVDISRKLISEIYREEGGK